MDRCSSLFDTRSGKLCVAPHLKPVGRLAGRVGQTTILWTELEMASTAWLERVPSSSGLRRSE